RYETYVEGKDGLHMTVMAVKTDQLFDRFASPWESEWSKLVTNSKYGFTPIVDSSWQVIGHLGRVWRGTNLSKRVSMPILIMPSCHDHDAKLPGLGAALEQGVNVFVAWSNRIPDGWVAADFFRKEEHHIEVRTSVNGKVFGYQYQSTEGLGHPWYSPMDL